MKQKIRIGYACMNMDIQPNDYKTCRKENITDEGLRELIEHNLNVLKKSLEYNIKMKNRMFRISSSLIPFGSSPLNTLDWEEEFKGTFDLLKAIIVDHDMRISVHPGQYTVINSKDEAVVASSIDELEYHTKLLNLLSGNPNHKMILHVGGVYGDKPQAIERFVDVYNTRLSKDIKKYLIIENDDRLYTVEDVLNISNRCGVPVVFDNLHHDVNPSLETLSLKEILTQVVDTWAMQDGNPKMHYSQQAPDKRLGAHSESIMIETFIKDLQNYEPFGIDIMLEVKDKNRSFVKVDTYLNPSQRRLEEEWARYKYWVMSKSQQAYNALRGMFKGGNQVDAREFYRVIDSLYDVEADIGSNVNAYQHIWGYFKDKASDKEKHQFLKLIEDYQSQKVKATRVINYLKRLTFKYDIQYLKESYIFS